MEKELSAILNDISKKLEKHYSGSKLTKYRKSIAESLELYNNLEISEDFKPLYESLIKRGKELKSDVNLRDKSKVEFFLRYVRAAIYDFTGNIKPLNNIMKSFLLTGVLFFVLSPQYFSYALPLVFILPTFLGIRGMKKRTLNGLILGSLLLPMALMVSIVWLKNASLVYFGGNLDSFLQEMSSAYGIKSLEMVKNIYNAFILLSVGLLGSSVYAMYSMFKNRKMFI